MVYRGLDQDGNAGVVFERMAQVLLRCVFSARFKLQLWKIPFEQWKKAPWLVGFFYGDYTQQLNK